MRATAQHVIAPAMIGTLYAMVRNPTGGKRCVAMCATIFEDADPAFKVTKQGDRFAQYHGRQRPPFQQPRLRRNIPKVPKRHCSPRSFHLTTSGALPGL